RPRHVVRPGPDRGALLAVARAAAGRVGDRVPLRRPALTTDPPHLSPAAPPSVPDRRCRRAGGCPPRSPSPRWTRRLVLSTSVSSEEEWRLEGVRGRWERCDRATAGASPRRSRGRRRGDG